MASPIGALGISAQLPVERPAQNRPEPNRERIADFSLVKAVRTQLEPGEAKNALSSAWRRVFGEEPNPQTSAILTAQWAHETARGNSMYNFNFGGIKGAGPSGFSVLQCTKEGYGATEREIRDRFRAYGSAEEGAVDYVQLLNKRFPQALEAARAGDSEGFVRALKARGYFTGDEAAYVRSVNSLSREMLGTELTPVRRMEPETVLASVEFRNLAQNAGASLPTGAAYGPTPFVDAMSIADALAKSALRLVPNGDDRRDG